MQRFRGHGPPVRLEITYLTWVAFIFYWLVSFWWFEFKWKDLAPEFSFEVMGKIQPPEAVDKHQYTSIYGAAVSLTESPLVEGLLYVGTDDGLVHVSEDGGATWRKIDAFPGVPHKTFLSDLVSSRHAPDRVYTIFDNHTAGDFKTYLLRSNDRVQPWESIA